jgi:DNA ligase D-like protein (predicted 3'-phosphoesterase)
VASPIFVVQQHDATAMHYDVRLEVDGVLVSWAVPRGPSYDPVVKRLAIMTTDHDMAHADVEGPGMKPNGRPGGVIVWDRGTYVNLTADERGNVRPMRDGIERGHVKFWLEGTKLEGTWALTRTGDSNQWLLVKVKDATADAMRNPVVDEPASVLSGLTIDDMRASAGQDR